MRKRIYVAGPISKGDLQHNIDQARKAGRELIAAGFAPMIPQLSCFLGDNTPAVDGNCTFDHADWLEVDTAWVACADAVLRLPGVSMGADQEVDLAIRLGIPIFFDVRDIIALVKTPTSTGREGFYQLLREMGQMFDRKNADYGRDHDILANFRSEEIGIPAWKGAWLRARDKVKRLDAYCVKGSLSNEGAEDSWMDLAVYCLICLLLHRETKQK